MAKLKGKVPSPKLFNMIPALSLDDITDHGSGQSHLSPYLSTADSLLGQSSNSPNRSFRNLTTTMSRSSSLSPFSISIFRIGFGGSQEQMGGSNTERIITVVKNVLPFRNWTEMKHPRFTRIASVS
jgi:hypothetical protein